jgi:predicted amidohydrolase
MTFSVALLQISPTEISREFNLEKGIDACRKAKALGADLALFPEMWHIGYAFCPPDKKGEWEAKAIDQQSDFFQAYTHVAKELGLKLLSRTWNGTHPNLGTLFLLLTAWARLF